MKFIDAASRCRVSFTRHPPSKHAVLSFSRLQPCEEAGQNQTTRHDLVESACRQALIHGIRYLWAHDFSLDNDSEVVLASWDLVCKADLCIVYLFDLAP